MNNTNAQEHAEDAIRTVLCEISEALLKDPFNVEHESDLPPEDYERYLAQVAMSQVSVVSALQNCTYRIFKEIREDMKPGAKKDLCISTIRSLVSETKCHVDIEAQLD